MAAARGKRGVSMPSEEDVTPGPHRELLVALHQIYVAAARPGLRPMSAGIRRDNRTPATVSHQKIGLILSGKKLPDPRQLISIATWLWHKANVNNPDKDNLNQFIDAMLEIRTQAEGAVAEAQKSPHKEDSHSLNEKHHKPDLEFKDPIPSGYLALDDITGGLHHGRLIVIAAHSGVGKSSLAVDIARLCSIKNARTSLLFSLQLTRDDIAIRLISADSKVSLRAMQTSRVSMQDWERIAARQDIVSEAPLYIHAPTSLTFAELSNAAKKLHRSNNLELIVVDSMDLLSDDDHTPEVAQGRTCSGLRSLARDLNIPIVALHQIGRRANMSSDIKPTLRDIPEQIETVADTVILLHREDAHERESPRAGEADFIVAKNRNGPTGTATLAFQGHYARFVDMLA